MYHYNERRDVGEQMLRQVELHVAVLSSDPEWCQQFGIIDNEPDFIVRATLGCHTRQEIGLDRAGAETLHRMLGEALAAAPAAKDGGTWTKPLYQPRFEVVDNVEAITDRLACCGAGPDQRDERTGERLHLPACPKVLAAPERARRPLFTDGYTIDDDDRARFEELVDAGALEPGETS